MGDVDMAESETEEVAVNDKLEVFLQSLPDDWRNHTIDDLPSLVDYVKLFETCGRPPIQKEIDVHVKKKILTGLAERVTQFFLNVGADAQVLFRLIKALNPLTTVANGRARLYHYTLTIDSVESYVLWFRKEDRVSGNTSALLKLSIRPGQPQNDALVRAIWENDGPFTQGDLENLATLTGVTLRKSRRNGNRDVVSSVIVPTDGDYLSNLSTWFYDAAHMSCLFVQHPIVMQSTFVDLAF